MNSNATEQSYTFGHKEPKPFPLLEKIGPIGRPEPSFILDPETGDLYCNQAAYDLLAIRPDPPILDLTELLVHQSSTHLNKKRYLTVEHEPDTKNVFLVSWQAFYFKDKSGKQLVYLDGRVNSCDSEGSLIDPNTQLFNKKAFDAILKNPPVGFIENGGATVFLDLDGLGETNNTQGHQAGDDLLKKTSENLRKLFREIDIKCRIGGDEFVVLLPGVTKENLENITTRIKEEFTREEIGISFGIQAWDSEEGKQALINAVAKADQKMYEQKKLHHQQTTSSPVAHDI